MQTEAELSSLRLGQTRVVRFDRLRSKAGAMEFAVGQSASGDEGQCELVINATGAQRTRPEYCCAVC